MTPLDIANKIINHAFKDKKDLSGEPYINHLNRVAKKITPDVNEDVKVIALLHDLLEDCPEWNEDVLRCFFNKQIVDCLVVLTKTKGEDYFNYIEGVSLSGWATKVKLADLEDNMNVSRLKELTQKDFERLQKYIKAYQYLKNN